MRSLCALLLLLAATAAQAATITGNTWTPQRTETGALDPADVASLPVNTWVAVDGSTYRALRDEIVTAFNAAHGTSVGWSGGIDVNVGDGIAQAVNAWSSGYYDTTRGQLCNVSVGGHTAGGVVGTWCWDVSAGEWAVPEVPANPNDPRWCDSYRKTYSTTQYPRDCLADNGWTAEEIEAYPFDDRLPNGARPAGTPTARHWYGTQDYDPATDRVFGARTGLWTQDRATNAWSVVVADNNGAKAPIKTMAAAIYNEYADALCGLLPLKEGDYFGWRCIHTRTGVVTPFPNLTRENCKDRGCAVRRIPGTSQVIAFTGNERSNGEAYSIYDLAAQAFVVRDRAVTGDRYQYDYQNEIPAMTYVPHWLGEDGVRGLWVRINSRILDGSSCAWSIFNHRTGVQWRYLPDPKPSCARYVGNKLVYTERLAKPLLVLMSAGSDTTNAMWYMRLADYAPAYPGDAAPVEQVRTDLGVQIGAAAVVKLQPGLYAGGVRIDGPKDIDFAGTEVAGGTASGFNGRVEPRGSEPIILRNLTITDPNYAGVWVQGAPRLLLQSLTIANSKHPLITPNDGGELYVAGASIKDSIASNPGFQHPMYIGEIDWFESAGIRINGHKQLGHLFKSRARVTVLRDAVLDGGETRHSRGVDYSCGGFLLLDGVTIRQSPNADNAEILAIGPEANRTAAGEACEHNGVPASTVVLRNVTFAAGRADALIWRDYNTHRTRWVCLDGNDWGGMTPPPCDTDTAYSIPANSYGDDNPLRAEFLRLVGADAPSDPEQPQEPGDPVDPPDEPEQPTDPTDPPLTRNYGIDITAPSMTITDDAGADIGLPASRSLHEAMEKASRLPPGKYYLVRPTATITVE